MPNARGAERAIIAGVDEINFVMSASDTHNQANMRMTASQSLLALRQVIEVCRGTGVRVHGTIATTFGCPFEGHVPPERVFDFVGRHLDLGVAGVTLADTTGMANPRQVAHILGMFQTRLGALPLTLHFHNTRGMGLANILTAFNHGFVRIRCGARRTGRLPIRTRCHRECVH